MNPLSGNLGFVSLDEVLRLLTRSSQQGRVEVKGEGVRGRVFLGRDGIDLATTIDEASLQALLVRAGLAEGELPRSAEEPIVALLREVTVESLYQLSRSGGDFEVFQGDTTPYASPRPFDLESALADVRQRAADWQEVSQRVPDLTVPVMFVRDLEGRDEVKISREAWKVLSEIGRGQVVVRPAGEDHDPAAVERGLHDVPDTLGERSDRDGRLLVHLGKGGADGVQEVRGEVGLCELAVELRAVEVVGADQVRAQDGP